MYSRIVSQATLDNVAITIDTLRAQGNAGHASTVEILRDEANAAERANEALVMQLHRLEDELDKEREKRIEIARMKSKRAKTTRGARGQRG
jgi:hypothetical protein